MAGYFEDSNFSFDSALRGLTVKQPFQWKRPWQIASWAQLYKGGRLQQGLLRNSWFLAAIDLLSYNPELRQKLLTHEDSYAFSGSPYNGQLTFRFWNFGEWTEVTIDDLLPTYCNNDRLVFAHTDHREDFWAALLEKAYAKLLGGYYALRKGDIADSLTDLTGGLVLRYEASKVRFKDFRRALDHSGLVAACIEGKDEKLDNGLIKGLTYSVTEITTVSTANGDVELLKLRSPWGNEKEWHSKWSDGSGEWETISDADKERLGVSIAPADDAMFWISLEDFKANFTDLVVGYVDASNALGKEEAWEQTAVYGKWAGDSAGGCKDFPDTFANNPQFKIRVDSDDGVFISLSQKKTLGSKIRPIGFSVYECPNEETAKLDKDSLSGQEEVAGLEGYPKQRDVADFCALTAGTYIIIPFTVKAQNEGDFVMRMFASPGKATFL